MLAVDASALVAIARREPEAEAMQAALAGSEAWATPINILEAGLILILRDAHFTQERYRDWLASQNVFELNVVGAEAALDAYLRFGKGVHRAGLNMGDCFAYALARHLDAPLLYKGDDFALTDVRSALQPT